MHWGIQAISAAAVCGSFEAVSEQLKLPVTLSQKTDHTNNE